MTKPTIPLVCACGMLALALAASAQPLPAGMTVEMSLEEALGKMAMYQTGHSRLPISVVSDHIVTLQNRRDEKALRQFSYTLLGYLDAYWASAEGKREIIRQLAKISGSEAVPALAKAVKDKDLWDMALLALEDIPSREADAALRELLSTSEGRARLGVIQTLGLRGDPASVGPLSRILAGDADTTARVTAARALARIGGRSARAALLDSLDDPSDPVHRELADAIMALAQGMARSGDRSGAYRLYERLHRPAEPTTVRSAALLGMLTTAGGSRAEKLWVQSIHGDAEAQRIAVQAMTALTGRKTTAVMASELPKLPPTLQAYVIAGLSARSDREALPAVTTVAESGAPEARRAALAALGALGDAGSVPLLVAALGAEDKATSAAARASLDRVAGEGVNAAIVSSLASQSPRVRAELCASLAARGAFMAGPDLLLLAERDPEADVRTAALKALGDVALRIDLPAMLRLLAAVKTDKERDAAQESIVAVARRSEDASERVQPVLAAWGDAEGAYRASLARILGRLQGQQAQSTLIAALSDSNEDVSLAALRALSEWNDAGPRDTLYQVAKSDAGTSRKVLALRGFIRQAGMEGKTDPQGTVRRLQEAMDMASRDEERRMVLAELAKIPDPAALAVVLKYTESESLGSEAIAAAMDIVEPIAGSHREAVMPVLEKYGPKLRDPKERAAASELLSKLRQAGGFLTTWQVAGPFRAEGRNAVGLIDTPLPPETGGAVEWRELRLPASSETPGFVSLARVGGELPRVAYLKTSVQCPRSREVTLAVGSDDGLKVWLNGQVVHSAAVLRGAVADADKIKVRLQAGANSLMLKVSDAGGGWGVFCRFLDDHGKPIEDLAVGGR